MGKNRSERTSSFNRNDLSSSYCTAFTVDRSARPGVTPSVKRLNETVNQSLLVFLHYSVSTRFPPEDCFSSALRERLFVVVTLCQQGFLPKTVFSAALRERLFVVVPQRLQPVLN